MTEQTKQRLLAERILDLAARRLIKRPCPEQRTGIPLNHIHRWTRKPRSNPVTEEPKGKRRLGLASVSPNVGRFPSVLGLTPAVKRGFDTRFWPAGFAGDMLIERLRQKVCLAVGPAHQLTARQLLSIGFQLGMGSVPA